MKNVDNYFGGLSEEEYIEQTSEHFKWIEEHSILSDEEIIKALECCSGTKHNSCHDCPLDNKGCEDALERYALDLINRKDAEIDILIRKKEKLRDEICELQAEIERLKPFEKKVLDPVIKQMQRRDCPFSPFDEYCTGYCVNCENWSEHIDYNKRLKVQAYQELTDELKRHCSDMDSDINVSILWDAEKVIDGVLKDMTEGNK